MQAWWAEENSLKTLQILLYKNFLTGSVTVIETVNVNLKVCKKKKV